MPTNTYTPLATVTLASTDAEIVFSSIPATYRDLIMVYNGNTTSSGSFDLQLKLNADSSNHSAVIMFATGSGSPGSFTQSSSNLLNAGSDSRTLAIVRVMDYSATNKHKTSLIRIDSTGITSAAAQRWASTSAVNSLTFSIGSGVFAVGSTFSLYGVIA
jgi:hypothetical protein